MAKFTVCKFCHLIQMKKENSQKPKTDSSFHELIHCVTLLLAGLETGLMLAGYYSEQFNKNLPIGNHTTLLKVCFVPAVLLAWFFSADDYSVRMHQKYILFYFLFSWLGDTFLLRIEDELCFTIGGLSFLTSHIFTLLQFRFKFPRKIPLIAIILYLPIAIWPIMFMFPIFIKHFLKTWSVCGYILTLLTAGGCATLRFTQYGFKAPTFLCCYIGYLLFTISDSILLSSNFYRVKIPMFTVMVTYGIAVILIVTGFTLQESTPLLASKDKEK